MTVTARAAIGRSPSRPRSTVAGTLALVEARRLLRHPLLIAGAMLGTAVFVLVTWSQAPVLNRHDSLTTEALLPLAGALLVAAHLATLRSRRHRVIELYRTTPATEATVTLGLLIAVGLIGCAALGLACVHLAYAQAIGGVATPRPLVVLTGPAVVVLAGAMGVAMGRLFPWVAVGPLAVIGVIGISVALMSNCDDVSGVCKASYFSPLIVSEAWNSAPSELSYRPSGAHLSYVAGLAIVAGSLAFIRRGPRKLAATVAASATGLVLVAGYAQTRPVPASARAAVAGFILTPVDARTCKTYSSVRYCAYPAYARWIERWRMAVEPVAEGVPGGIVDGMRLSIVQRPHASDLYFEYSLYPSLRYYRLRRRAARRTPNEIAPGLQWARHEAEGDYQLTLAVEAARRIAGIETDFRLRQRDRDRVAKLIGKRKHLAKLGSRVNQCLALDQGRVVVALWLAARATASTKSAFIRALDEYDLGTSVEFYGLIEPTFDVLGDDARVSWGNRDAHYARQLLARPEADVMHDVQTHWDRLVDPATDADRAARLLGLRLLPSLREIEPSIAQSVYQPLCR